MNICTGRGWTVGQLSTSQHSDRLSSWGESPASIPDLHDQRVISGLIGLHGTANYEELAAELAEIEALLVAAAQADENPDLMTE